MPRITKYSPGRRWYCNRDKGLKPDARERGRCPFTFVIIGPTFDNRPGYKLCRLEYDRKWLEDQGYHGVALKYQLDGLGNGSEGEYSHAHLRKYATLEEIKP